MEVSMIVNQSTVCNTPDGPLLHVLKEPELVDEDLRHSNNSVQEQSQNSEVGNIMTADSVLLCNGTAMEDPLVTVLNGDYRLGTQIPIEYLDIFEILREEVLAAEAREIEVIENGFLNSDESPIDFQSGENEKGIAIVEHEVPGSIESSVSREATTTDGFALPQDDVQEESRQTDILDSPKRGFPIMQAQSIEKNGQAQIGSSRAHCQDAEGIDPDTEDIEPSGHGQTQLRKSSAHPSGFEGTGPDERDVDPSDKKTGQPQLESPSSEVTGPKKGDGDSSNSAQVQLGSWKAYPNEGNAELSASGKGEDGDGCVQNGTGAENVEAAPGDFGKGVLQHEEVTSEATGESGSIADRQQNVEEAGNDGNSHILIVEVTGDAEGSGISNDKGDNGDALSQSDKHSEHSEDEDHMSSAFSGPIAFSGMLSYSGMISYSGQIPYSGNLSLHSDSSASTRSFAFPVLASDWNSSPTKIGPPDSRYFRRRRRWRPRFCCRRPTTLFD